MNRRAAAIKEFRYIGDRLLATDGLKRNRAFGGRWNMFAEAFLVCSYHRELGCC